MVNLLWIFFFIGIGLLFEQLVKRQVLKKYFLAGSKQLGEMTQTNRFLASLVNAIPDLIGLCFFFAASYLSFVFFEQTQLVFVQLAFLGILISFCLIRSVSIIATIILSPKIGEFRLLPLTSSQALILYRIILGIFSYLFIVLMFSAIVDSLGAAAGTTRLLQFGFASFLLLVTAIAVLLFRKKIQGYILGDEAREDKGSWGLAQFAAVWHLLAILYLVILWLLLINAIASPKEGPPGAFILSFFVVPIWFVADKIVQWLVSYLLATLKIHEEDYEDTEEVTEEVLLARERGLASYEKTKTFARIALVAALTVWVAELWSITIPFFSDIAAVVIDSLIILTVALFFWKFISSWIERKIEESVGDTDEDESTDDEWGGAAARGRSYTLLPMIRKMIASVLSVMVILTILSSMGVDIGPLLAGAGVIGLAVGFGAQKMVADMFSGFFYLLDDAFRVGEYLTAGSVSGTVEAITLRNVMLRHHRGMLQIVPHSELGAITNFMRGGMIVKFNLDFPYDTDIDKVRKIIKKVGVAMLDDPELGKDFIQPVKSQGVREITNSVMTIRVKFTAQPGTHFVIRREAFRRITEALKARGIEYAHRKVIVDVPGLEDSVKNGSLSAEDAKKVSDAAGAAAMQVAAEEPATKPEAAKPQIPE